MAQVVAAVGSVNGSSFPSLIPRRSFGSEAPKNHIQNWLEPVAFTARVPRWKEEGSGRGTPLLMAVVERLSPAETEVLPVSPEDLPEEEDTFQHLKGIQKWAETSSGMWTRPSVGRKTKIVCTIGPSTSTREMIWKLAEAGMNVARLNMSHGDHTSHQKVIDLVREYNSQTKDNVIALMLDTKAGFSQDSLQFMIPC